MPAGAYALATSKDGGHAWNVEEAKIECPPELGLIARPLPHILADGGAWLMPAYSWSKTGNRALLLRSADRGQNWRVLSTIATAQAILQSGTPLTTPWLETAVARTADGSLPGGPLILLAAHTRLGCFLHLSADGTGHAWGEAQSITKVSGSNTSLTALDPRTLLIFTPGNKRITCWKVALTGLP